MRLLRAAANLAAISALLAGCGSSGGSDGGTTGGGGSCGPSSCNLATATNATPLTAAVDGGDFQCAYTGLMAYEPCISEGDSAVRYTLLCSDPSPPTVGLNTFTVAVTDGKGNPLPNLPLSVNLWMPQHCHGPGYEPFVDGGADGIYTVSDAYLFMDGVWQLTFTTADAGYKNSCPPNALPDDSQQFNFCVGG
jgi:hypothetical protein